MQHDARIVLLDIETLPNIVASWGLWVDGALSHDNIVEERTILCAAWKWLGEKEVHAVVAKGRNDLRVVRRLHDVLSSADAVVTHNGDKFDLPWIKTRALIHGLPPLRPIISIDTRKIAKRFYFNNNRLDYLGAILKTGRKIETTFGLWLACMQGSRKALRQMVAYNKEDVRLLERVYLKLRAHAPAKLNLALDDHSDVDRDRTCPNCGDTALQSRGFGRNRATRYVRLQCMGCGAWSSRPCGSKVVR